jgi:uncharacterized protein involved in type VI secretion and phage assembly
MLVRMTSADPPEPMGEDRGASDQQQLDALVERARTGLRDWTDRADSDPGVALLDLFAFVGDLLSSHSERVTGQAHLPSRRDSGVAIELGDGAHGRRPPDDATIGTRYRHGGDRSAVLHQQDRVVLDEDAGEQPARTLCGVHRATVIDAADPLGQHRVMVQFPDVERDGSVWAAASFAVTGASGQRGVPAVGAGVRVAFEAGDPARPVWLGVRVPV